MGRYRPSLRDGSLEWLRAEGDAYLVGLGCFGTGSHVVNWFADRESDGADEWNVERYGSKI